MIVLFRISTCFFIMFCMNHSPRLASLALLENWILKSACTSKVLVVKRILFPPSIRYVYITDKQNSVFNNSTIRQKSKKKWNFEAEKSRYACLRRYFNLSKVCELYHFSWAHNYFFFLAYHNQNSIADVHIHNGQGSC